MQLVFPTFLPVWSTVTLFNQSAMGYYINPPWRAWNSLGVRKTKLKEFFGVKATGVQASFFEEFLWG